MVSLYYACMRETEADSNGGCGGGFDTTGSSSGSNDGSGAGSLIFRYYSNARAMFYQPSQN